MNKIFSLAFVLVSISFLATAVAYIDVIDANQMTAAIGGALAAFGMAVVASK